MSFNYALSAAQQTPTSESKPILCKSFKIDIAAGSGFTTATAYDLGWIPKDAQIVDATLIPAVAVSGGTVSAASLAIGIGGNNFFNGTSVYTTSVSHLAAVGLYLNGLSPTTDQKITYTPTLTGSGATAGVIYLNIQYVA
jgi:hypothetical protein